MYTQRFRTVSDLPTIAASLALKSDKHSIPSGYKVMFLHRSTKGIAEGLDYASVVRSWSIVESKRFSAVTSPRYDRGFYSIDSEAVDKYIYC